MPIKNNPVGERIHNLRLAHRLSLKELAHQLGVFDSVLCQWEKGARQVKVSKLPMIAEALHITVADLVDPQPGLARGGGTPSQAEPIFEIRDQSLVVHGPTVIPARTLARLLAEML